jgi:hypothetical protein
LSDIARARNAGNVDDHAATAAFDHVHGGLAGAQEHAPEVNRDHFRKRHFSLHLAVRRLHQEGIACDAGIVDEAIDVAEVIVDALEQRLDRRLVGHVSGVVFDLAACFRAEPYRRLELCVIDIDQCEFAP